MRTSWPHTCSFWCHGAQPCCPAWLEGVFSRRPAAVLCLLSPTYPLVFAHFRLSCCHALCPWLFGPGCPSSTGSFWERGAHPLWPCAASSATGPWGSSSALARGGWPGSQQACENLQPLTSEHVCSPLLQASHQRWKPSASNQRTYLQSTFTGFTPAVGRGHVVCWALGSICHHWAA